MKDSKYYTCDYCYEEFLPSRRRVQKFCCNSCRSKAYRERKEADVVVKPTPALPKNFLQNNKNKNSLENTKSKVEQMSFQGVGNAALGTLAADGLKSLLTKNENKPLTKGDIKKLVSEINGRFHEIKNMAPNNMGQKPFYDIERKEVVYRWTK
ncbi:hypothetical protein [Corallibacter sp.]|uniref:hypothetical protein n=1 Tax=Corallibacter sp. TaxID=2038084 RepID=UPI003AB764A3